MSDKRAKVCRFYSKRGARSEALNVPLNGCDLALPPSDGNDYWLVFLPLHGMDAAGPFYLWREFAESDVAASPNRSIHVEYLDSELIPEMWPHGEEEGVAASLAVEERVTNAQRDFIRSQVARMDWPDFIGE